MITARTAQKRLLRRRADLDVHAHHAGDEAAGEQDHGGECQYFHDLVGSMAAAGDQDVEVADDRLAGVACFLEGRLESAQQGGEAHACAEEPTFRGRRGGPRPSTRSATRWMLWAASTARQLFVCGGRGPPPPPHKLGRSSSPPRRSIGARFRAPAAGSRRARRRRRSPLARGSASRPRTCRRCRSRSRARSSRR